MNFIDYKGNLEIIVNYGGEPLLKAVREDVKGDHLLHAIDILNGEIINGMEKILKTKLSDWTSEFKTKP